MNNNHSNVIAHTLSSRKLLQLLGKPQAEQLSHKDIQAIENELSKRNQLNTRWPVPH